MKEKIQKYFICFVLYAIFGWCYEVFLEVVVYKWEFSNRGVLFGPYCPVYGVGAMLFLLTSNKLIKDKELKKRLLLIPVIFLTTMITATAVELVTSYLCELFLGSWPWQTYARDYKIHFQGRIALSPSLRFGLGGVLFLYIVQPLFDKMCEKLGAKRINIISIVMAIILVIDAIYTFILK